MFNPMQLMQMMKSGNQQQMVHGEQPVNAESNSQECYADGTERRH